MEPMSLREENQDLSTLSRADPPELQPTCASPPAYSTSAWTSWSPSPRRPLLRQKSAKQTGKLGKTSDVLKTWINKLVILAFLSFPLNLLFHSASLSQHHCHKTLLIYKDSTYLAPLAQTQDLMISDSDIPRSVNQQQTGPKNFLNHVGSSSL